MLSELIFIVFGQVFQPLVQSFYTITILGNKYSKDYALGSELPPIQIVIKIVSTDVSSFVV